jgi:EmrB/QacA subfamily drug resistance transporter
MAPDEMSYSRRMLVLAICCMSLFIVGLDVTIVNVALPSIGHDLHAGVSGLQWTIDAYTLVLASLLMLAGSTADRLGRRRTFQTGLATFALGSLLCSVAPGLGWLVAFRMLQAVGGSMLNPVAMSIITNTFLGPKERAKAIGIWGGVVGLSMALGPITGGLLVETVGWRGIFWVNVPVGIAAIVLTALFVPESRAARARKVDPVGQVLVIILLAALVYALIEGPGSGWTSAKILGCFGISALALIGLARYETRREEPLIDLRFFRSAPFSGAVAIAICAFAGLGGFLLVNTLYLQDVRGYSPLLAGVYTLPMAAMTAIFSPLSGRLVGSRGTRPSLIVAGLGITAAGLVLTQVTAGTSSIVLIGSYVLFGMGFGMVNAPITNSTVSGMPRSQAGVAAGVASTSRQVGSSLGVAVIGSATISALHGPFKLGFASASHAGWWIVTGCGVAILCLGLLVSGAWARETARRTASRLIPAAERSHDPSSPVPAGADAAASALQADSARHADLAGQADFLGQANVAGQADPAAMAESVDAEGAAAAADGR